MSVPTPTTTDIAAIVADLGYRDVAAAPEECTAVIAGMLGVHDAVENVPEPQVLRTRGAVEHRVPSREEDPHHAWEVRTSFPGAPDGPLRGLRLGVKDSITVAGLPMTNGTDVLADFVPGGDATVVARPWTRAPRSSARRPTSGSACPAAATRRSPGRSTTRTAAGPRRGVPPAAAPSHW